MQLTADTSVRYVRHAFSQMLEVADRLGDDRVNERPLGPDTNAVAALIFHCCGVAEFWLGHVGMGRPSNRDRDSEFSRTGTVAELRAAVGASLGQIEADVAAIAAGRSASEHAAGRQLLLDGDESDAALVLHVIEELFQHLGHAEIAADALLSS